MGTRWKNGARDRIVAELGCHTDLSLIVFHDPRHPALDRFIGDREIVVRMLGNSHGLRRTNKAVPLERAARVNVAQEQLIPPRIEILSFHVFSVY